MKTRSTLIDQPLKNTGRSVDWTLALCRNHNEPDRWHVDHITAAAKVTDAAKEQCNKCPIKAECLEYALVNKIPDGVWGGKTTRERRKILKQGEAA